MGDRQPIRDRTLILRILVPGLETRLRDKMKEVEEGMAESRSGGGDSNNNHGMHSNSMGMGMGSAGGGGGGGGIGNNNSNNNNSKETLLDLDGVTCEPTQDGSTLWNFHCDGATYPARLVNLPCPVELHKTHDHAMYFKCVDIAQMLIVYEDSMALDEADAYGRGPGDSIATSHPSYYHSGLTPPLKRVVERRFALREHPAVPPPRAEVIDVEKELHELMCKISKEGGKRNKVPSLASAQHANKVLEEVVEEIVDYEPWMDDYGRQRSGIELDASDQLASLHPELWLTSEKIQDIIREEREKEEEEIRKKQAATAKKEKKKKKKDTAAAAAAAAAVAAASMDMGPTSSSSSTKKKGIASKKNETPVDEVTQAAMEMASGDLMDTLLQEDDPLEFGFDFETMGDDGIDFTGL